MLRNQETRIVGYVSPLVKKLAKAESKLYEISISSIVSDAMKQHYATMSATERQRLLHF
jgi:hypothetical protein